MNKTKAIATGGLFVALYAIFFIVSMEFGGALESSLFFLLPLPLAVFTYKFGIKLGLIPYISVCIVSYFINPISTIFYVIPGSLIGLIYGHLLTKNKSTKLRIFLCIIITLIVDIFSMVIFAKFLDYSLQDEIKEIFAFILKILRIDIDNVEFAERLIYASIPIFIAFMAIIEGILIHMLIVVILNRLKLREENLGKMFLLLLPKYFAVIYSCLFLAHISTAYFFYKSSGFLYVLGFIFLDLFWAFSFILFIQGFLSLQIVFARKKLTILFLIINIIFIAFFVVPYIFVISMIGNILVFSDSHKYLLYNNKYYGS